MDRNFATLYRPQCFGDVVGQVSVIKALKVVARGEGIVCRSIFLRGAWGSGKTTLARLFGRAMNCERFRVSGDVCNGEELCSGCREVLRSNSQLYLEFDSSIVGSIEGIRGLGSRLEYLPSFGRRVVVLDEVHSCSVSALNALLKLVEEGIKDTIFVFCSTEGILPTLQSRSLCLEVHTVSFDEMRSCLSSVSVREGIALSDSDVRKIFIKSGGHLRDALSLLQLYSMIGAVALQSSLSLVEGFMFSLFRKDCAVEESIKLVDSLLDFSCEDIRRSIDEFLRLIFVSSDKSYVVLRSNGIGMKLFTYFYGESCQCAFNSEAGIRLMLLNLLDKVKH